MEHTVYFVYREGYDSTHGEPTVFPIAIFNDLEKLQEFARKYQKQTYFYKELKTNEQLPENNMYDLLEGGIFLSTLL